MVSLVVLTSSVDLNKVSSDDSYLVMLTGNKYSGQTQYTNNIWISK